MAAESTNRRSVWKTMVEVVCGVAIVYFVLGGHARPSSEWAIFTVFAAWIVVMNERLGAGSISEEHYSRWKMRIWLIFVIAFLASPLWLDSWWTLIVGLIMGLFWLSEMRAVKQMPRQ